MTNLYFAGSPIGELIKLRTIRIEFMNQKQRQDQMIAIAARMRAEGAEDMSDAEIERTLSGCCAPTRLIAIARAARDSGEITLAGPVSRRRRMKMSTAKIIETERVAGEYDMPKTVAIIEHPKHGRLYMAQGFGGMDTLAGGAVRWRHGLVAKLQPSDTLDSLRSEPWNEHNSAYQAMLAGYDDSRPILDWDGEAVASVAQAAGLRGV